MMHIPKSISLFMFIITVQREFHDNTGSANSAFEEIDIFALLNLKESA